MKDVTESAGPDAADLVPGDWPSVRDDTPRPARTVRGLLALPGMFLFWLAPRRAGAALAAAGWRAALAAHVFGVGYGLGMILWAQMPYPLNPFVAWSPVFGTGADGPRVVMTLSELLRAPLAALVITAHDSPAGTAGLIRVLLITAAIEGGVVVMALAMMPFAAAGESAKRLFARCLRLTWWSTTMAIPLGLGWILSVRFRTNAGLPADWQAARYTALSLFGAWWLTVLLRSGYRYAGPAEGPAWRSRTPRCEGCGYIIAHIPKSTNCPECGKPVAQSFPERRIAPPFVSARGFAQSLRAFIATDRAAISDRSFFSRLAVRRDHARDRRFFMCYALVIPLLILLFTTPLAAARVLEPGSGPFWMWSVLLSVVIAVSIFAAQVIGAGLLAVLAAAIGRRAVQPSAIVTFYAVASLLPAVVGISILTVVACNVLTLLAEELSPPAASGVYLTVATVVLAILWLAVLAIRRLRRAFSQTRRANA